MSVSKTNSMVEAANTEANQVLGSPPIVSIQRVESITSKATVSYDIPILGKSRSEEGNQNPISPRGAVLEKHSRYLSRTPFMRGVRKMA